MTSRKKPGVAFWATVVVVAVLVAYPLSFGPACWLTSAMERGHGVVTAIYRPILWTVSNEPAPDDVSHRDMSLRLRRVGFPVSPFPRIEKPNEPET
jgi:hypothetical protein